MTHVRRLALMTVAVCAILHSGSIGTRARMAGPGARVPDPCRAAGERQGDRRLLGPQARDQPHGHDPAHLPAERDDRARGQPAQRRGHHGGRLRWPAVQRHRRLQGDRGGGVHARVEAGSGAERVARRADRSASRSRSSRTATCFRRGRSTRRSPPRASAPSGGCTRTTAATSCTTSDISTKPRSPMPATGKRSLLDVAIKNANLVQKTLRSERRGVTRPGTRRSSWRWCGSTGATNDRRYFDLAKFFMDERGKPHASQDYPRTRTSRSTTIAVPPGSPAGRRPAARRRATRSARPISTRR